MKKIQLFNKLAVLVLCCILFGCTPEDNLSNDGTGSIYGCVTDFATGDLVANANVQLRPSGETTLTGSDGNYEFLDVPCGTYSIKVTKEGYSDLIDDYDIVVTKGRETKRDVQIRKLPSSLHIYDNESHEISELDFGADEGVTQKTFNIFNGGSQNIQYVITMPMQANWVSINQDQLTGTVGVNVTYPIIVTINRELLVDGNNTTILTITSSTDGGKELTIKARKSSAGDGVYELASAGLMVQTENLGCVDWSSAKLLCENSTVAGYNDWRLPTKEELMTLYSNREQIGGFNNGKYWSSSEASTYHYYYIDFSNGTSTWDPSNNNHHHVRAVRTMTSQNATVELPTANLMVQTQDIGKVNWNSAKLMCENSAVAGYNDWRLPTLAELMTLYTERDNIGGFQTGTYWSSEKNSSGYPQGVYFGSGSANWDYESTSHYVRAVRSLNGNSPTLPTLSTTMPSNVSATSASCGGNVTSDGGASVTERGVCWSTSSNPTVSGNHVESGSGTGTFTCNITGLNQSTRYYVRAYATNSAGTAYGEQEDFTTTGGGGGGGGQTYTFDFESSWQGWQDIDADGDGYTWNRFYSSDGNIGHNGSVYTMGSESYSNDMGIALYPDNYLVSPQRYSISNGAKIKFYVCAQDADYPAEHYGVAVSTQSTPDSDAFVTIWEETLSAKVKSGGEIRGNRTQGTWYLKTIDLSVYTGQSIWIAIRHFNCYDEFMIDVDDITIVTGN